MGRVGATGQARPSQTQLFSPDYEAMRDWALDKPRLSSCPAGVALLLRRGLAAWLALAPNWPLPVPVAAQPAPLAGPNTPTVVNSDHMSVLISVLATLVEHAQQEVAQ